MKRISLGKQRSMYRSYRDVCLGEADVTEAYIRSGSYGRGSEYETYERVWDKIMKFVDGLEDSIVVEARRDREVYLSRFEVVTSR